MLKKLIIIIAVSFLMISFSNLAWSSVVGTWEIDGKITTTIKVKGIKTIKVVEQLDDVWKFNSDNSFETENIVGTWNQKKTKVTVYLNDNDIIQYYGGTQDEELGTTVTVDKITKKTCAGTENTKKRTIKGSFRISMNITVQGCVAYYDHRKFIVACNRTGTVTVSGSYTGIPDKTGPSIPTGPTQTIKGTYALDSFRVVYSNGVVMTDNDVTATGSWIIGDGIMSQNMVVGSIPIAISATYTLIYTEGTSEGYFRVTDSSGTHDSYFLISGNRITTYSGVVSLGNGLTYEEWDTWTKVSDSIQNASSQNTEKQISSQKSTFQRIGDILYKNNLIPDK